MHRVHLKTLDPTSHFTLVLFTAPPSFTANINLRKLSWKVVQFMPLLCGGAHYQRSSQQMFYLLSDTASDGDSCPPEANHFHSQIPLRLQSLPQCQLRISLSSRSGFQSSFDQMSFEGDYSPTSVSLSSILWDGEGQNSGRSFLLYKSLATDIVKGSVALHCVHNLQIKAP